MNNLGCIDPLSGLSPSMGVLARSSSGLKRWSLTPSASLFAPAAPTTSRALRSKTPPKATQRRSIFSCTPRPEDVLGSLMRLNSQYHSWSVKTVVRKPGVQLVGAPNDCVLALLELNNAYLDTTAAANLKQPAVPLLGSTLSRVRALNAQYTRQAPVASQGVVLRGAAPPLLETLLVLNQAHLESTQRLSQSPGVPLLGSKLSALRQLNAQYVADTSAAPAAAVPLQGSLTSTLRKMNAAYTARADAIQASPSAVRLLGSEGSARRLKLVQLNAAYANSAAEVAADATVPLQGASPQLAALQRLGAQYHAELAIDHGVRLLGAQ